MTEKKSGPNSANNSKLNQPAKPAGTASGDFADKAAGALARLSQELARASPTQQAIAGGGSGILTGYLFGRVGRTAALALGGGLICLSLAQQRGLISVNWRQVERQAQRAVDEVVEVVDENVDLAGGGGGRGLPELLDRAKKVLATHKYFAGTFAGGFLIGLAAS